MKPGRRNRESEEGGGGAVNWKRGDRVSGFLSTRHRAGHIGILYWTRWNASTFPTFSLVLPRFSARGKEIIPNNLPDSTAPLLSFHRDPVHAHRVNSRLTTCFQRAAGRKYTPVGSILKTVWWCLMEEGGEASLIRAVCMENGGYFGLVNEWTCTMDVKFQLLR